MTHTRSARPGASVDPGIDIVGLPSTGRQAGCAVVPSVIIEPALEVQAKRGVSPTVFAPLELAWRSCRRGASDLSVAVRIILVSDGPHQINELFDLKAPLIGLIVGAQAGLRELL